MTNTNDCVRILLKAYGEELTVEQMMKFLPKKKDELLTAIQELVSSRSIIETAPETYKTAESERPAYFYVFQSNSFMQEYKAECLFCSYSPERQSIAHWDSINEVKEGDIIIHECSGSIFAVSEAQGHVYDADRPYPLKDGTIDHGRRLNTKYVFLKRQMDRKLDKQFMDDLFQAQPEILSPFDKNAKGREGYLFHFNEKSVNIIYEAVLSGR